MSHPPRGVGGPGPSYHHPKPGKGTEPSRDLLNLKQEVSALVSKTFLNPHAQTTEAFPDQKHDVSSSPPNRKAADKAKKVTRRYL